MDSRDCFHVRNASTRALDVLLGLLPLVVGLQLIICISYIPTALHGYADFRNCYSAGVIVRTGQGHRLYDYNLQQKIANSLVSESEKALPYIHLPYEALIFVSFSFLSYRHAYLSFLVLNVALLFIIYILLYRRLWQARAAWLYLPFFLLIGFSPITATLLQGQDSLLTLFLFSAALLSFDSERDLLAGLFVGFALYKFQLVIPILFLFLLWRRFRFLAGVSISAGFVMALSVYITGVNGFIHYAFSLRNFGMNTLSQGKLYVMPASNMANLRGLIQSMRCLSPKATICTTIALSAGIFATGAWAGKKCGRDWQFALAISATALVAYYIPMHDLSMLLIPIAVVLNNPLQKQFWAVPLLWLSTPLCFVGYSPLVAISVLLSFVAVLLAARSSAAVQNKFVDSTVSRPLHISGIESHIG